MARRMIVALFLVYELLKHGVSSETVVIASEGPLGVPEPPAAKMVTMSCSDGTSFECLSNTTQCFPESPVYCNFSVDLVKDISTYRLS